MEEIIDYTTQLEELILQSQTYNNNLIQVQNDLIKIFEITIILFGFLIAVIVVINILKVIFND